MAQAFMMRRGGGSGLSTLKVTAVANYASLPSTPKLYQLCMVSATAVNHVYVTNTAPASPAAGDVQLLVGSTSSQPVPLSKNGDVLAYPVNAYQYTGSVWMLRDLYTWNGTAWVVPPRYLVKEGIDIPEFGGASVFTGSQIYQFTGYKTFMNGELRKPNAIDVTPYRSLYFHAKSEYLAGKGYVRLALAGSNMQEVMFGATEGITSIDLSAQTGLRYVGCSSASTGTVLYDYWMV